MQWVPFADPAQAAARRAARRAGAASSSPASEGTAQHSGLLSRLSSWGHDLLNLSGSKLPQPDEQRPSLELPRLAAAPRQPRRSLDAWGTGQRQRSLDRQRQLLDLGRLQLGGQPSLDHLATIKEEGKEEKAATAAASSSTPATAAAAAPGSVNRWSVSLVAGGAAGGSGPQMPPPSTASPFAALAQQPLMSQGPAVSPFAALAQQPLSAAASSAAASWQAGLQSVGSQTRSGPLEAVGSPNRLGGALRSAGSLLSRAGSLFRAGGRASGSSSGGLGSAGRRGNSREHSGERVPIQMHRTASLASHAAAEAPGAGLPPLHPPTNIGRVALRRRGSAALQESALLTSMVRCMLVPSQLPPQL